MGCSGMRRHEEACGMQWHEATRRSWSWVLKERWTGAWEYLPQRGADVSEGTHAGEDIWFDWRVRSEGWLEKQMLLGYGCLKL